MNAKKPEGRDRHPLTRSKRKSAIKAVWGGSVYHLGEIAGSGPTVGLIVCGEKFGPDSQVALKYVGRDYREVGDRELYGYVVVMSSKPGLLPGECSFVKALNPVPYDSAVEWFLLEVGYTGGAQVEHGAVKPIPVPAPRPYANHKESTSMPEFAARHADEDTLSPPSEAEAFAAALAVRSRELSPPEQGYRHEHGKRDVRGDFADKDFSRHSPSYGKTSRSGPFKQSGREGKRSGRAIAPRSEELSHQKRRFSDRPGKTDGEKSWKLDKSRFRKPRRGPSD